jgi:predicted 3-demethylubiquinone-9 3-methyltransferase (glyoxalase superfamily)
MSTRFVTHLWLESGALEAARFYTSIFPNSRITAVTTYTEADPGVYRHEPGSVMTVSLELDGNPFMLLNGGPMFRLNEAFSVLVECHTQDEIDRYWDALLDGGEAQQCGWLKDRFGVSWQIACPADHWLTDPDPAVGERVLAAVLEMTKIDIATLEAAARGQPAPAA